MKLVNKLITLAVFLPAFSYADVSFTSTADGKAIKIPAELFDTPAAKNFLATGKNSYIGNQDAAKAGKKVYQIYSCTQCHGAVGNGQVGPNLRDDTWNYAKNATDQGIFETIWAGTAGGMGAKGKGLMQEADPTQGLTPDEVLKVVAFLRTKIDAAPAPAATPAAEPAATSAESAPAAAAPAAVTKAVKKTKKIKKVRKAS